MSTTAEGVLVSLHEAARRIDALTTERDALTAELSECKANFARFVEATRLPCGHDGTHWIDGDDGPCLACYAESK